MSSANNETSANNPAVGKAPSKKRPLPVIYGIQGLRLTPAEKAFFRNADPLGFILFARNVDNPAQLEALNDSLRDCVARADVPILVDQEGGRVARLKAPHWPEFPAMHVFGKLAERDVQAGLEACELNAFLLGQMLARAGFTVNCAPVLDLPQPGAHGVIGDRALSADPDLAAVLGRAVCDGHLRAGVLPVIKHAPGHGRAKADSHHELPVIGTARADLARHDFRPFMALKDTDWVMVAHIALTAIDPGVPASQSRLVTSGILRQEIGLTGLLVADDIFMEALEGSAAMRARACINAGMDIVLHCHGGIAEMEDVANALPRMGAEAIRRLERGETRRQARDEGRVSDSQILEMTRRRDSLLAPVLNPV